MENLRNERLCGAKMQTIVRPVTAGGDRGLKVGDGIVSLAYCEGLAVVGMVANFAPNGVSG